MQFNAQQPPLPPLRAVAVPATSVTWRSGQARLSAPCNSPHVQCPLIPSSVLGKPPASFSLSTWHAVPNPPPAPLLARGTCSLFPDSCGTWKGLSSFSQHSTAPFPAWLCRLQRQDLFLCSTSHKQLLDRSWPSLRCVVEVTRKCTICFPDQLFLCFNDFF